VVIKTELFNVLQINLFIILYFYFSLFSDISTKAIDLLTSKLQNSGPEQKQKQILQN